MAQTVRTPPGRLAARSEPAAATRLAPADAAKFTAAVALLAILSDAAVGHALAWENDPYWTYWVTKTFLIATVFGLGTAWVGVGAGRGAAITAVHTVVLTVYYWSLSPIGLPSHPSWLDLEHTWVSGVPIHFGVIYLGYLAALWLWRRREARVAAPAPDPATLAWRSLAAGTGLVVVAGAAEALALGEFQGATWYVVRLLITVPFLFAWQALAGRDVRAAISGAVLLTAVLATYTHFLGPVGLPDLPLRVFERAAPGATAHWLDYRQEALVALPITLVAALGTSLLLARAQWREWAPRSASLVALAAGVVLVTAAGAAIWPQVGGRADLARVTASGTASVENGPWFGGATAAGTADLAVTAVERNPRVTPLPPHDEVQLTATVRHPDGGTYEVIATRPMVDDPLGRFGTWWGVGLDVWHHGRSGIGTELLPATHSEVALFAVGGVRRDGAQIATGVPVHVMTMRDGRVELDVGDPGADPVPGLPDGHLRVLWDRAEVETRGGHDARYVFGLVVLAGLFALVAAGLRAER